VGRVSLCLSVKSPASCSKELGPHPDPSSRSIGDLLVSAAAEEVALTFGSALVQGAHVPPPLAVSRVWVGEM
jgi:hypothetical protein